MCVLDSPLFSHPFTTQHTHTQHTLTHTLCYPPYTRTTQVLGMNLNDMQLRSILAPFPRDTSDRISYIEFFRRYCPGAPLARGPPHPVTAAPPHLRGGGGGGGGGGRTLGPTANMAMSADYGAPARAFPGRYSQPFNMAHSMAMPGMNPHFDMASMGASGYDHGIGHGQSDRPPGSLGHFLESSASPMERKLFLEFLATVNRFEKQHGLQQSRRFDQNNASDAITIQLGTKLKVAMKFFV
jgi:hypothetical protein